MIPHLFIIDTNVLVAGLITSDPASPTAMILDAMLDGRLPGYGKTLIPFLPP